MSMIVLGRTASGVQLGQKMVELFGYARGSCSLCKCYMRGTGTGVSGRTVLGLVNEGWYRGKIVRLSEGA